MSADSTNLTPDERARKDGDSDDDDALADVSDPCKVCGGAATVDGHLCRACDGTGRQKAKKAEEINPKKLQPARLSEQQLAEFYDLSKVRMLAGGDQDTMSRSWVPVFPEGTFHHPEYGELVFDAETIPLYIKNFDDRVRHIDIAVDVDHRNEEAVGWVKQLDWRRTVGLYALVEWNRLGEQKLGDKQYRYISAQFGDYKDEQTGEQIDNVISALTITNFPFLKRMSAIQLSEQDRLRQVFRRVVKLHRRIHEGAVEVPEKLHKTIDLWLDGRTLKSLPTPEQRLAEGGAILAQGAKFLAAMGPNGSTKGGGKLPHEKGNFAPGDNADEGGPSLDDEDAGMKKSKKADDDSAAKKIKRAALLQQLKALDDDEDLDDDDMKKSKKADDDDSGDSELYDQDDAYGDAANMDVHKDKSAQPTRAKGQKPNAPSLAGQSSMADRSMERRLAEVQAQLAETRRELRVGKVADQAKKLSEGSVAFSDEIVKEFKKVALADKAAGDQLFRILSMAKEEGALVLTGEYGDGADRTDDTDVIQFSRDDQGGVSVGMTLSKQAREYAKEHSLDFNDPEDRLMAYEAVTTKGLAGDADEKRPARAAGWR